VRPVIHALAFAVLIAQAASADSAPDPSAEARAALEPVIAKIVTTARDSGISPDAKRALIEHELGIWIDYGHAAAVALGPLADELSSRQLADFAQEFERYLSDVYIRRIARFDENQVVFEAASLDVKSGVVTVRTIGGAPLGAYLGARSRRAVKARAQVDYLMRRQRGDWRIIALRVDGVDLTRNFREQFESFLEESDPEALIAELRKRNAEREAQNPWK
jgi:ABC-type transporter MlaC component